MAHRIEAAKSGRAACATCGEPIVKGEVRVAELYQDTEHGPQRATDRYDPRRARADREPIYRFHHVPCAATAVPAVVKSALNAPHDRALIPDREKLDAQLATAVDAERKKRIEAATAKLLPSTPRVPVEGNLAELLVQLAETPDDPQLLQVTGDLLGELHGELITTQLAIKNARVERAPELAGARTGARDRVVVDSTTASLIARRDALMSQLAPKLGEGDRSSWGVGFVQRLELGERSSGRLLELEGLWQHPAMPILRELRLDPPARADEIAILGQLAERLPRSLRRLEIGGRATDLAALARLVAVLPRLETLELLDRAAGAELAHPTLASLAVAAGYEDTIPRLSRAALPALRKLVIRGWYATRDPFAVLANSGWLAQLESVHLDEPARLHTGNDPVPLALGAAQALRDGLAGKQLARLEITGVAIPLPVRAVLTACARELIVPSHAVVLDETSTHVEHTGKPEWGRGKIVGRKDGKLEVKFGKAVGTKVFRADAPFLKPAT